VVSLAGVIVTPKPSAIATLRRAATIIRAPREHIFVNLSRPPGAEGVMTGCAR
jgi:hypothetical protein